MSRLREKGQRSPGDLRHRITIQTRTATTDGAGGSTYAWATHVTAWASVMPIGARESMMHGGLGGSITHRIRMRYQAGILPSMRVSHRSRILKIEGVRNVDEENRWLELDCVEEPV